MKKTLEQKQVVKEIPKKKVSTKSIKLGEKEFKKTEEKAFLSPQEQIIQVIYGGNKEAYFLDFPEQQKQEPLPGQDTRRLIDPFRYDVRKDTAQELLDQNRHFFTRAEYNAISELLYSNYTVEVEIYNGKLTTMSSTKYCSNPNGILRLNTRTTKDSSNE